MRSSSAVGVPRPSRLLVVTHRVPSGAVTAVRSRPNWLVRWATGVPTPPVAVRGTCHSRRPRSPAAHSEPSSKASPLGDASAVVQVSSGLVKAGLVPVPSTVGHP